MSTGAGVQGSNILNSNEDITDNDTQQLNSDTMEVTPEHPVYVEGEGWLWAENLSVGDRLRRSDGGMARVLAIERVELAEPELVYNFTVKGPHTYFVLEAGVLVHNCGDEPALSFADRFRNLFKGKPKPFSERTYDFDYIGDALDKLVEIRVSYFDETGELVLFRGWIGDDPGSPLAMRAPAFRDDPRTVEQIAEDMKGTDWVKKAIQEGEDHAKSSHNSEFLSLSEYPLTTVIYVKPVRLDRGTRYIEIVSIKDPKNLRSVTLNPNPNIVDRNEALGAIGIINEDIIGIVSFRPTYHKGKITDSPFYIKFNEQYTDTGFPLPPDEAIRRQRENLKKI